jgi:Protein of unknown function (DUF3237)
MNCPDLEFMFEIRVDIGPIIEIGNTLSGLRRTVPIIGGTFRGPQISGRVLPGGADSQLVEKSGLTLVDARYVIETKDGVRIEVRNRGVRHGSLEVLQRLSAGEVVDPKEYYFRTSPRFEPPNGQYEWLRTSVFIGSCERYAELVVVKVWKVL